MVARDFSRCPDGRGRGGTRLLSPAARSLPPVDGKMPDGTEDLKNDPAKWRSGLPGSHEVPCGRTPPTCINQNVRW